MIRTARHLVPLALIAAVAPLASGSPAIADQSTVADSVLATLDPKVDACTDFYQFACGGWLNTFELPGDEVSYTRSFSSIDDKNTDLLHTMLEDASKATTGEADWLKIGATYGSCVDTATIDSRGIEPVKAELAKVKTVKNGTSLMAVAGDMGLYNASPLFGVYIQGDMKDPTTSIMYFTQAGLGLPDRQYYLDESDEGKALRAEYLKTIEFYLTEVGEADPAGEAAQILAFETELAKLQKPQEDLRDPQKTYNKFDRAGLQALTPGLDWDAWFTAVGIPDANAFNVDDPDYLKSMAALVKKTKAKNLKPYLTWHWIMATNDLVTTAWDDKNFEFFGKTMQGRKEQRARWKRCVDTTVDLYPEIVGKYYVEKAFPGDSKASALEMINNIEAAFQENLPALDWMDDATRARAVEKMKMIKNKIGYPDIWRDYSAVTAESGKHFENVLAGRAFESRRVLAKVGKPVDRNEFGMPASMVNAYYDPLLNEIAFPAGIMQEPFYSTKQPVAMNYGAMGMVMGHELTHGFDDQGAQFDGNGAMVQWWADDVVTRFGERTKCVVDQYDQYEIAPGLKVNGALTTGENIADMGGIKESFNAYKSWEKAHGVPPAEVPGYTNDQLFFIGYAQAWCSKRTPQIDQLYATVDPHSPPRWRVNGPLSSFPTFAEAFKCAKGTPMNPEKQCTVW